MIKTDVLIIGGGPAGIVAAVTARRNNPSKRITLIREKKKEIIPCGIPYIFNRLKSVRKDAMPDKPLGANNIDLIIGKAVKINTGDKRVSMKSGREIRYGKLILATGSSPVTVPIDGVEKRGVWRIEKDFGYLEKLRKAVLKSKNIVIIGGGFIGVEIAEELSSIKGLNVNVVEKGGHCLIKTFDREFALAAEKKLKEKGVKIHTNKTVKKITGKGRVESVEMENRKIPADLVILSIGAKPETGLAGEAGIKLGKYGGIKVNKYMETSSRDVFAIGDCAETRCLLTKKHIPIMLASTACHEARIAASNLYRKSDSIKNDGTLAVFSTFLDGLAVGIAGLNEKNAEDKGLDIVTGTAEAPDHHPGTLPGTRTMKAKLIFSRSSGKLLGGQVMGPKGVGEMINILALAIQQETNIYAFDTLQIATHPLLTAAPTVYPLITAAQSALMKMK